MAEGGRVMLAMDESECSIYALEWALENLRETAGNPSSSPPIIFTVQPIVNLSCIPAAANGSARMFTSMTARRFPLSSSSSSLSSSSSTCYMSFSLLKSAPELVRSLQVHQKRISLALPDHATEICAEYGVRMTFAPCITHRHHHNALGRWRIWRR